jgi:hypothetical protein
MLARRVAAERAARGWSNETLARRMSEAGCAIQPSALYKIQSEPPRRITVNELVGLSAAFGVSVQELLAPADQVITGLVKERFDAWLRVSAERDRVAQRVRDLETEIRELLDRVPEAKQPLRAAIGEWLSDYRGYNEADAIDAAMHTFTRESTKLSLPVNAGARSSRRRSGRPAADTEVEERR